MATVKPVEDDKRNANRNAVVHVSVEQPIPSRVRLLTRLQE